MYVDENGKTHYSIHDNIEDIKELPDDDDTLKHCQTKISYGNFIIEFILAFMR